jgi:chemotaxis protein MotB
LRPTSPRRRALRERNAHSSHAPEPSHERWLVSYADFITLLFAFFVVLYATSTVNEGKFRVVSDAMMSAFRHDHAVVPLPPERRNAAAEDGEAAPVVAPPPVSAPAEPAQAMRPADPLRLEREQKLPELASKISDALAKLVESGQVRLTQDARGLAVEINASVLFAPGQATLQPASIAALQALTGVLNEVDNGVEIEGHTDDVPIASNQYPSNWELSSARASAVVRLFVAERVAAGRLTAIGYADNRPVEPNATPAGRARNRRVTLLILSDGGGAGRAPAH